MTQLNLEPRSRPPHPPRLRGNSKQVQTAPQPGAPAAMPLNGQGNVWTLRMDTHGKNPSSPTGSAQGESRGHEKQLKDASLWIKSCSPHCHRASTQGPLLLPHGPPQGQGCMFLSAARGRGRRENLMGRESVAVVSPANGTRPRNGLFIPGNR